MNKDRMLRSVKAEKILFQGGHILDPGSGRDKIEDLLIINGKIEKIGSIDSDAWDGEIIDCKGKIIVPGFIDMHVHLREPGHEDAETIESGCRAAMAGGLTSVCCMPNTQPVIDSRGHVEFIRERASGLLVDVFPIAAVTKGQKGEEITEMGDILDAGAVGFSDDGYPVANAGILRRALEYAAMFQHPIIDHCEDMSLSGGGVMNEGFVSTVLGMRGIPPISEDIHVARDILVAEYTGGHLHIAHVSTMGSVRLIREAKNRGVRISAETCPHYLVLTDEAVRNFDTSTKMKPPLRTEEDQKALLEGLKDGTIDVISSDHAPHPVETKETEYDAAAFGVVGLETLVGLIMTHVVQKKVITLSDMIEKMAINPRKILNLPDNRIEEKHAANITLLDPNQKWTVDRGSFQSQSRNTPFHGWELQGKSMGVVNNGQILLSQPVG